MPEDKKTINNLAELKDFLKENQFGYKKKYSILDLKRFMFHEKEFINSGQDIAKDFLELLPTILHDKNKLQVFQKEDKETQSKEMAISCFILSVADMEVIFKFLDSFNQPVVEFKKLNKVEG